MSYGTSSAPKFMALKNALGKVCCRLGLKTVKRSLCFLGTINICGKGSPSHPAASPVTNAGLRQQELQGTHGHRNV